MMRERPLFLSLMVLFLISSLSSGCARIRFLQTMEKMQLERVRLHDMVEAGESAESARSARRIEILLQSDEVVSGPFSDKPQFAELHRDMLEAIRAINKNQDQSDQVSLYGNVTSGCDNCHSVFKKR